MKRITSLLAAVMLLLCLALSASASEHSLVTDQAGLLSSEEVAALEEISLQLAEDYGIHAVILTVDSLGGQRAQEYADEFYDQSGYGEDGVLFLLALEEREWYLSTCGSVIYALTDYGVQQLGEAIVPCLAEEYWYTGFYDFLDSLPYYLDAYEQGDPIDGYGDYSGDYYHGDQEEVVYYEAEHTPNFLLSVLCGMVVAGIVVFTMGRTMNTRRAQYAAGDYLVEGSWDLTRHQDLFLYSNVTKTRKQEPPRNTGGGSSVHRSSSGRRHGGGGGRF